MKRLLLISVTVCLLVVSGFVGMYFYTSNVAKAGIFKDAGIIESRDVALVLGTSRNTATGQRNPYFYTRVQAAAQLYKMGKVKKILVSGDNRKQNYNEPQDMLTALIAQGIPKDDIILDYAGFRTFDSMVRAKEVFGQVKLIVVSQQFQLERALYIASTKHIDAIGYTAEYPRPSTKIMAREVLARTRAFLDCNVLGTAPHFLGPKEEIVFCSL